MSPWRGPTLQVHDDHLLTLDQTCLPFEQHWIRLDTLQACEHAIVHMQVRGAPLIGAVAAFGLALALREGMALRAAMQRLAATRPTAVNLQWALARVEARLERQGDRGQALICARPQAGARAESELPSEGVEPVWMTAWQEACRIAAEDIQINAAIGAHGLGLLRALADTRRSLRRPVQADAPLQILTHCNAGRLAAVDHGTALAPIYAAHSAGLAVHVWVDETRPRNQGASLTAWELMQAGVPCTVVADNAGGWLMQQGRVDAVIVGCDRVAANGDVANKIGTLLKALAARDAAVPFWVACPTSTLDLDSADGARIPIEMRSAQELTHAHGQLPDGQRVRVALMQPSVAALNPAFDVTPARLVDALITEQGVIEASPQGIQNLVDHHRR